MSAARPPEGAHTAAEGEGTPVRAACANGWPGGGRRCRPLHSSSLSPPLPPSEGDQETMSLPRGPLVAVFLALLPGMGRAADIDGATLSLLWGLPFAGILL